MLEGLVPLVDDMIGVEALSDMLSCALAGDEAPATEDDELAAVEPMPLGSTAGMSDITAVMSLAAAPFEFATGGTDAGLVTVSEAFSEGIDVDG